MEIIDVVKPPVCLILVAAVEFLCLPDNASDSQSETYTGAMAWPKFKMLKKSPQQKCQYLILVWKMD